MLFEVYVGQQLLAKTEPGWVAEPTFNMLGVLWCCSHLELIEGIARDIFAHRRQQKQRAQVRLAEVGPGQRDGAPSSTLQGQIAC